jgi:hypothetical protein
MKSWKNTKYYIYCRIWGKRISCRLFMLWRKICGSVIRRAMDIILIARNVTGAPWWFMCLPQSPGYLLFVSCRRFPTWVWFIAVPVLLLSSKWQHDVHSVGSADNIAAFVPKTDEKLLRRNFMLSGTTGHKNEYSSLLGCHVMLTDKQLHLPFLYTI